MIVTFVLYTLACLVLLPHAGKSLFILVSVPVLVTAWLFGALSGIAAGLLAFPLNLMLVIIFGFDVQLWLAEGGILGSAATVLVGVTVGYLSDVRHRLNIELTERRQAEQALRESEDSLRNFTENVMGGIFRTTPEGEILFANADFAKMFGWDSVAELEKINAVELYTSPKQREEMIQLYEKHGQVRNLDIELQRKDGSPIWVRVSAQKIVDEAGNIKWYEGFLTDLTDSKQLEAELLKAQKLESIGKLAAGI